MTAALPSALYVPAVLGLLSFFAQPLIQLHPGQEHCLLLLIQRCVPAAGQAAALVTVFVLTDGTKPPRFFPAGVKRPKKCL